MKSILLSLAVFFVLGATVHAKESCSIKELNEPDTECVFTWGSDQLIVRNKRIYQFSPYMPTIYRDYNFSLLADGKEIPLVVQRFKEPKEFSFDSSDLYSVKSAYLKIDSQKRIIRSDPGWMREYITDYIVANDTLEIIEATAPLGCFSPAHTVFKKMK